MGVALDKCSEGLILTIGVKLIANGGEVGTELFGDAAGAFG